MMGAANRLQCLPLALPEAERQALSPIRRLTFEVVEQPGSMPHLAMSAVVVLLELVCVGGLAAHGAKDHKVEPHRPQACNALRPIETFPYRQRSVIGADRSKPLETLSCVGSHLFSCEDRLDRCTR